MGVPIEMPFSLWTLVGPQNHVLGGVHTGVVAPSGEYHCTVHAQRQCGFFVKLL